MVFSNEAALKAALVAACTNAVAGVEKEVYGTFDNNLMEFYGEFSPKEYIRTYALDDSLAKTGVRTTGSGASAEVYFTTPSYSTGTWSGGQVLDAAMHGSHGGYVDGTAIWDESIGELGDIEALLVQALRAQGVPIK